MSITQSRLDNYLAAEARILALGESMRRGDKERRNAELATIRDAIASLQAQLANEQRAANGCGSLSHRTAVFDR